MQVSSYVAFSLAMSAIVSWEKLYAFIYFPTTGILGNIALSTNFFPVDISLLTDVFPRIYLNFFATPLGEQSPTLLEAEEVPEFLV